MSAQKAKGSIWALVKNGKYTADARSMARALHKAGCAQGKIGGVIQYVAQKAGLLVKKKMSRRTVQRLLIEGGVAARIQLAYEMAQADGLTASGDATSLRAENYESCHVMINKNGTHKNRVLGINSTTDHTSETQVENWKKHIARVVDIFKRCPLAQRSAFSMNSDHASDQKKTVQLMLAWKEEISRILLGWDEILKSQPWEILGVMANIRVHNIEEAGGEEAWNKLSNEEKDVLTKSSMDALALRLGTEAYDRLSPEEKREISLFFWAGCSMHKELNSCKAFGDGMNKNWVKNSLEGPVLLANKDNDATIQLATDTGTSTASVQRALKVSERGAVKLVALFGAYVNHKDAKKGCHDVYENHFRPAIGAGVRFPAVTSVRYQSFGLGMARILSDLPEHQAFMLFMKDRKEKRTLNHLEENICKGLNCSKTIAEMVAFVLYCMSCCHPYAAHVRGRQTKNLNILSLGPYHEKEWSDPIAFAACLKLAPTLPDLKGLILNGLKWTLTCWDRFTSEFEVGGAIDLASEQEKEDGYIEATNDANEGLPGSLLGHFEDQAMFNRNETQEFMDTYLNTAADEQFIMQEARAIDASREERRRREELDAHHQQAVDAKHTKDAAKAAKVLKTKERLGNIALELDRESIGEMTNNALKDQLELYRERGDKEVPMKSKLPRKADLLAAVLAALERHEGSLTSPSSTT
ncbi:hypothetical protein C8R43DRAFT_1090413 [Mycena crocata]|nr:hypothetical protein C8R43DRAFT_1090413 [Mycena crocata]